MNFRLEQKLDPQIWEAWLLKQPYPIFVQSPAYGQFYQAMGEKSQLWGVYDEQDRLIAGTLLISVHARRGNFWLLPYGPVIADGTGPAEVQAIFAFLTYALKKEARAAGLDFVRISPFWWRENKMFARCFAHNEYRRAPMHVLAENTWLLDINPPAETLFKNMEKNHRNLIKRCENEGVKIVISHDAEALADFNRLHDVTASRHKFHRFSKKYITEEFLAMGDNAAVIRAYLPDGRLDAAGIFMFYGQMSAYRHGASLMLDKRLPTSYAVQWAAIQEAQKRGCTTHNFWGIAPDGANKKHPFFGITHFKKGFGGYALDLIPCQDLPVSVKYYFTWIIEKIRSIRRGFSN